MENIEVFHNAVRAKPGLRNTNHKTIAKTTEMIWHYIIYDTRNNKIMTELSCIMVKDGEYTYLIRFGMVTLTVYKWSPRIEGLFSFGAPFFARTSTSAG